ncbi:MAG TPA: hypothetical protein H9804_01585 [Candidatus Mucispirillum faecigallinarum]|uniref:Uncharacterized protein n=1 Tax=Candidatus Mucispirillum faecigallinarum TaxID=2838699 RepID=A0A9D2K9T3_9BACT|nr:hypothetical protein [Candidatus Mucispirillum faecigallinarum]
MNYDKLQRKLYQNLTLTKKYSNFHDKYLHEATIQLQFLYNYIKEQIGNKTKIPYIEMLIAERICLDVYGVNIS